MWLLELLILGLAVWAVVRKVDVRLVLVISALTLAALAGQPARVVRAFLATFADEKFVVPICSAMGFAYVLRHTGCDRHLVHLLVRPLERVRRFLIPGTVLVGFLVNIPIISQTSTAVTVGTVLVPLLSAARISPATSGAALLLGSSLGGELLNQGAPELRSTVEITEKTAKDLGLPSPGLTSSDCVAAILPLDLMHLVVTTAAFWFLSARSEPSDHARAAEAIESAKTKQDADGGFRIHYLKAAVPLVPLLLLSATSPSLPVFSVPEEWLVGHPPGPVRDPSFDSRLIGAAMLVGVVVAALVTPGAALGVATAFWEGAGYAYIHIISLIVSANCFGEALKLSSITHPLGRLVRGTPALLWFAAAGLPLGFAVLCGSGMAATQSLFGFFAEPALLTSMDPARVGAVVSLAAAAGRTMSPVAAVTLMCAALTRSDPVELARRVALPLLIGLAVVAVVALIGGTG